MSTIHDSKFRRSRVDRLCDESDCRRPIKAGDEYLDYKIGLRSSWRVCMHCALQRRLGGEGFRFYCRAVVNRAADQQREGVS